MSFFSYSESAEESGSPLKKRKGNDEDINQRSTLTAKRCRTYRQREEHNAVVSVTSSNITNAKNTGTAINDDRLSFAEVTVKDNKKVNGGSSAEILPSMNALYCQRYRNKKTKQQGKSLLPTTSSLMINENQVAMEEKDKKENGKKNQGKSRNALYCQRYRNKNKMQRQRQQQQQINPFIVGSSFMTDASRDCSVEKDTEENEQKARGRSTNALYCQRYRNKKKMQQQQQMNSIIVGSSFMINESQDWTLEKDKKGNNDETASDVIISTQTFDTSLFKLTPTNVPMFEKRTLYLEHFMLTHFYANKLNEYCRICDRIWWTKDMRLVSKNTIPLLHEAGYPKMFSCVENECIFYKCCRNCYSCLSQKNLFLS